jgi:hypothetical protein
MLKHEWEFKFSAVKVAQGARRKAQHHRDRLKFWEDAKAKVMTEVKESGIEVSESEAGGSYTNAMRTPQVLVRSDLQTRLTECHQKMQEHNRYIREYEGWVQVLEGNPENQLTLHADDYLFFFGC